jgi:hypothetical protein
MTSLLPTLLRRSATAAFALAVSMVLAACGSGGAAPAYVPPSFRLLTSTPAPSSVNVPLDQVIAVRLTQGIDPSSVQTDSIVVTATGVGPIAGVTTHIGGTDGSEIRWTPAAPLPPATDHVCTVAASVRNTAGTSLGTAIRIPFRSAPGFNPLDLPQRDDLRLAVGGLEVGRQSHRATLLFDGRVLVTGGYTQYTGVTDVAEVFNPDQDRFFTLASRMNRARASHAQVLMQDGRVLLCGGRFESGPGQLPTTAEAEIYDPGSNSFVAVAPMGTARYDHAAVLLGDGRILVTGGTGSTGSDLDTAEVFNPATGQWTPFAARMIAPRATHGMVPFGINRFLVLGGSVSARHAELLDVAAVTFTPTNVPALEGQRFGPVVGTFASGAALLAGGDLAGGVVYAYAGTAFLQNSGSPLSRPRSYATATPLGPNRFLVVGGIDFSNGGFIDGSTDLVAEGGLGGSQTYATEVRFPTGMANHTATRLVNGNVMFCGGLNENGLLPNLKGTYILEVD